MSVTKLDTKGLKCPQPILKVATFSMPKGEILEVESDCPNFGDEIREWCRRVKKDLLFVRKSSEVFVAQLKW